MKKGFTIFEMLLVVVIMGILMAAFKDFFLNKDKNKIYFDTCVARTYGEINTFLGDAMTQKMVYTGANEKISPERYIIVFDKDNQKIDFSYTFTGGVIGVGDSMSFSGNKNKDTENRCWDNPYYTRIDNDLEINIAPGLQQGNKALDLGAFSINNDTLNITGAVLFSFCEGPTNCMPKTQIVFDKRSFNVTKKVCLKNTGADDTCEVWSE